jgi:hypothetical protein
MHVYFWAGLGVDRFRLEYKTQTHSADSGNAPAARISKPMFGYFQLSLPEDARSSVVVQLQLVIT